MHTVTTLAGVFNDPALADDNCDFSPLLLMLVPICRHPARCSAPLVQHTIQCIEAHGSIVSRERERERVAAQRDRVGLAEHSTQAAFHSNRFLRVMLSRAKLAITMQCN